MKSVNATGAVLATLLTLSGCASDVFEGKYAFREGWRRATVVSVVNGSQLERPRFWECTRDTSEAQRSATEYATVSYRGVSRQERRVVPLAPGMRLMPDDKVYVNLASCDQSLVVRR